MERRIYEAAVEGSVISLLNLLQEDALVLDRFMVGCYPDTPLDTPLHIASMLGHLDFVQEILNRKPELARELDARKSSPLHLATAKGYLEIVKKLVSVNPEMCFARDRDGRNPLHIATIKGHISILRELVNARPQAARMSIEDGGETILHVCVRYSQLEMLKLLVETIDDNGFLNSKCHDGNTILHVAVADKQAEVIEFLIAETAIEVNAVNAYGFTALDLSTQCRKEVKDWKIMELLRRSKAMHAKDIHPLAQEFGTTQVATALTAHENHPASNALQPRNEGSESVHEQKKEDLVEKMSNVLMVVASLIATMAFQVAVNPPGGLWQEPSHGQPGYSILADNDPSSYGQLIVVNTISFVASLSIILLLISGFAIKRKIYIWVLMVIMWVAITTMALTYLLSVFSLSDSNASFVSAIVVLYTWYGLIGILLLGHIIRLIVKLVKYVRKSIRQRRQPSSTMA